MLNFNVTDYMQNDLLILTKRTQKYQLGQFQIWHEQPKIIIGLDSVQADIEIGRKKLVYWKHFIQHNNYLIYHSDRTQHDLCFQLKPMINNPFFVH